jgi:carboxyl-terminal processing protease
LAIQRGSEQWRIYCLAVVWTGLLIPSLAAAVDTKADAIRREAEQAAKARQWDRACELYEQLPPKDRSQAATRKQYLNCLRHANLVRRHRDPLYNGQPLFNQDVRTALRVYHEVTTKLRTTFINPAKTDFTHLFQYGLDELLMALDEEVFRQERLPDAAADAILAFQVKLRSTWGRQEIKTQKDLEAEIYRVAQAGWSDLGLEPVIAVMEFACGACSGLDEYTLVLTPSQFSEVYASLEGEMAGIGIEVAVRGQKVIITQVLMGTPAAMMGLKPNDEVIQIDKKPLAGLSEETVAELLRGLPDTLVELEVLGMGDMMPRTLILTRKLIRVPSVGQVQMVQDAIGYCRLLSFQKTTVDELDKALLELNMSGMKVLILDLRGNWGGSFPAAVQVAARFLPKGELIVTTQSHVKDENRKYKAEFSGALDIPLVVLVDGETASAAEVVAGALRDHKRAKLVGQPTFGKGSIQTVLNLETWRAGGVRITLAKFVSPLGNTFHLMGVTPDYLEERTPYSMSDAQLNTAIRVAHQLNLTRQ